MKQVNIWITGKLEDTWQSKDYEILIAKLKVLCLELNLDIQED